MPNFFNHHAIDALIDLCSGRLPCDISEIRGIIKIGRTGKVFTRIEDAHAYALKILGS